MALLHLSDPHFGTERPEVCAALLAWAASPAASGVELIVVSGDITQRARTNQFDSAKLFFQRLQQYWPSSPLLLLPGNHDIPLFNVGRRLLRPFSAYQRAFGMQIETHLSRGGFDVQMVNTTRRLRHTRGWVSDGQIQRVASRLRAADPRDVRVVVTHQPIAVVREQDEEDLLEGREQALPAWRQAGADVILGGHIHFPYVCAADDEGVIYSYGDLAHAEHCVWVAQAGTSVSRRVRHEAGNSFNVLRRVQPAGEAPRACELERWDYAEAAGSFVCHSVMQLPLQRAAK